MKTRLQKFLADAGIASRRASEKIILDGRVHVNGVEVEQLGFKVDALHDRVEVDGRRVRVKRKLYIALNKPPGYICSRKDERNRPVIFDLLPKEWNNLFSAGRLDGDSEGLILVTNDGDLALRITHPRYGVHKTYVAIVDGEVVPRMLRRMTEGIEDAGEVLKAEKVRAISRNNSHSVIEIELSEGRNREVRRMFESQGLTVSRLQRIKIGKIRLAELPVGKWRALTEPEIHSLLPKL